MSRHGYHTGTLEAKYEVAKTDARVAGIAPDLRTRFRGRADRRAAKLNARRRVPFYRWEVARERGRWVVVALQNIARPL